MRQGKNRPGGDPPPLPGVGRGCAGGHIVDAIPQSSRRDGGHATSEFGSAIKIRHIAGRNCVFLRHVMAPVSPVIRAAMPAIGRENTKVSVKKNFRNLFKNKMLLRLFAARVRCSTDVTYSVADISDKTGVNSDGRKPLATLIAVTLCVRIQSWQFEAITVFVGLESGTGVRFSLRIAPQQPSEFGVDTLRGTISLAHTSSVPTDIVSPAFVVGDVLCAIQTCLLAEEALYEATVFDFHSSNSQR